MYKKLKSPVNVQLEVTGKCQNCCQHCYNFWREKGEQLSSGSDDFLSEKDAESVIQKLHSAEVFDLLLTGGEPLLNPSTCLASIRLARSFGMGVNMNSSLAPLTAQRAKALKDAGLNHILTSILGPTPEIHDLVTQRNGSFKLLMERVKIAQEAGIRISMNMVVSKLNIEHIRSTAEVVAGFGLNRISVTKAGCPGNCSDFSHLALNQEQLLRYLNDLCWIHQNLGFEVDTLEPAPLCGLSGVRQPELFVSRRCHAGVTTMTMSYNGAVRPCSHFDISYGNLLEEKLETIWSRMDVWNDGSQIPGECKVCPLFSLCGSGCRMEGKSRTGRINGLDPYAIPEKVPEIAALLKKAHPRNARPTATPERFKTAKFRLRQESFGGIVALGNNRTVFLDQRGFCVVRQLGSNTEHALSDLKIDWIGLEPDQFLCGLLSRNVINSTVERR